MIVGSSSPSRRTVCAIGVAALVAPFAPSVALATPTSSVDASTVVLFDPRFADGRALGDAARLGGLVACPVSGEVTICWEATLRPLWMDSRAVVVGATTLDALFCLELLANDAGHRLVHYQQHLASAPAPDLNALWMAGKARGPYRALGDMPTADTSTTSVLYSWVIAARRPSRPGASA